MPPKPMKHRNIRVDDETWEATVRLAELDNQYASDRVRELLRRDVARNKKRLDDDPVWQERSRSTNE